MSKEVQMSFRIEPELRAEFVGAALQEHRPAAQVLREFMRAYVKQSHERSDSTLEQGRGGPKWTQDEAIDFECAREVITDLQAILTGQIAEEGGKKHPDAERLAALRAERSRLFRERGGLHVKDHDAIARVLTEYGALVRSWRAEHQAVAV